jgi:hypothetical protein
MINKRAFFRHALVRKSRLTTSRGERMTKPMPCLLLTAAVLMLGFEPAHAAPLLPGLNHPASPVEPAKIYKRGRPPIYPYYYSPGRPGGYSFYFGFVPYRKGDYETQALQRAYPEANYPPSMRAWTPRSGF